MGDVVPVGLITIAISPSALPAGGIERLAYTKKISRAGAVIVHRPILFHAGAAQRVISITGGMDGSAPATYGTMKWAVSIAAFPWPRCQGGSTANILAGDRREDIARRAIATGANTSGIGHAICGV